MTFSRSAVCGLLSLALAALPGAAFGQAAAAPAATTRVLPPRPVPRQGQIMDVSGDPVLAALPVTRMTVDFDKLPPALAVRAMSVGPPAFEITYGYGTPDDEIVTLHLKNAPLIEALMEFRQQSRCLIRAATPTLITVGHQDDVECPPWCVAGPFAVLFHGITNQVLRNDSRLGAAIMGPTSSSATLEMDLLAEPAISLAGYMADIQCPGLEDDKHQPIQILGVRSGMTGNPMGMRGPVAVGLKLPDSPGRRIPLFRGTADATMIKPQRVELANVTEKQTASVGGMAVETTPLTKMNTSYSSLQVRYTRGTMAPEKWAALRAGFSQAALQVSTEDNGQLRMLSRNMTSSANDAVAVQYLFQVPAGKSPGAATLDAPAEAQVMRVPFEFKDIILP